MKKTKTVENLKRFFSIFSIFFLRFVLVVGCSLLFFVFVALDKKCSDLVYEKFSKRDDVSFERFNNTADG